MRLFSRVFFALGVVAIVVAVGSLSRADITWDGDIDPLVPAPTNWTSSTSAYIGKTVAATLAVDGASQLRSNSGYIGRYPGSDGQVTIGGTGSKWTNSYALYVGREGDGTLVISNGGIVSNSSGYIGEAAGATGQVSVGGANSRWVNSRDLYVGEEGNGTLDITNGGVVDVSGFTRVAPGPESSGEIHFADGTLTTGGLLCRVEDLTGTGTITTHGLVSDVDLAFDATLGRSQTFLLNGLPDRNITLHLDADGSSSMGAGYGGVGTLSISEGALIESVYGYVGYKSGSSGTVTVDGEYSTWECEGNLYIGNQGQGFLTVTGGGEVWNTAYSFIGLDPGSSGQVAVDGVGSSWKSDESLSVGREGEGWLTVTGGGEVSNASAYIARYPDSTGLVRIDGAGSSWSSNGGLFVGVKGIGEMTISGGAAVSSSGGGIGLESGSTGRVTVHGDGSTWSSDAITVGCFGSGFLAITGGGDVQSSWGTIGAESGSMGGVVVDGVGSTWTNNYDLDVGWYDEGTLAITDGGLVSVAGILGIDCYGSPGNGSINMASGGMLALASDEYGDDSLDDFLGLICGTDAIYYWDNALYDWALITDATYGDDYTLEYQATGDLAGYTVLTVTVPGPDGDFDGDFDVDVADLMAIQRIGTAQDMADWQTHFGFGAHADAPGVTTVPEPGALWLAVLGLLLSRRR